MLKLSSCFQKMIKFFRRAAKLPRGGFLFTVLRSNIKSRPNFYSKPFLLLY